MPVTGGMGGGSADAAATLLACDALWGTELPRDEMLELARKLGADVPFAFTGGTAIGTGRGDELSPALAQGSFSWVLALADFGLSTPEVYRELDVHRERHAQDIFPADPRPTVDTDVLQALRAGDPHMLAAAMHNDLQAPALHLEPSLTTVLELGEQNGALAGIVSGSGSDGRVPRRRHRLGARTAGRAVGVAAQRGAGDRAGARRTHRGRLMTCAPEWVASGASARRGEHRARVPDQGRVRGRHRSASTRAIASASSAATATASRPCCVCSPGGSSPTPGGSPVAAA